MTIDIKSKYPSTSTVALTATSVNSLGSSSTLVAGGAALLVDNTANLDLDHLLSGFFKVNNGSSPTINTFIEVWVMKPISIAAGTPTWPDVFDGTDSAKTWTTLAMKSGYAKPAAALLVDSTTTGLVYGFAGKSIKSLFGDSMPSTYLAWVTQNTGQALHSSGNGLNYERIQGQAV